MLGHCTTLCQTNDDCEADRWTAGQSFCGNGVCLPLRDGGAPCTADGQCASKVCHAGFDDLGWRQRLRGGGRVRRLALAALFVATATAAARPAHAAEKIAVLVLGSSEKESELADNLTEVLIAYVARHGGFEIAGKEEFRARLGVENERRAQECLDDLSCLGRAGVSLGVRRIVAGSVGTRGKQFLFNLNLNNVEQGKVESRVFRLVEGGVEDLIRAVQEASGELFRPHVEPGKIQVASLTRRRARVDRQRLPGRDAAAVRDTAGRPARGARRGRRPVPVDVAGRGAAR